MNCPSTKHIYTALLTLLLFIWGCGSRFSEEEQCFLDHFTEAQQAALIHGIDLLNKHAADNFPNVSLVKAKKQWVDSLYFTNSLSVLNHWDSVGTQTFLDKAEESGLRKAFYFNNYEWQKIIEERRIRKLFAPIDTIEVPLNIPPPTELSLKRDSLIRELSYRDLTINLDGSFLEALIDCSADSAIYRKYSEKLFYHSNTMYNYEFHTNVFPDEHKNFVYDAYFLMDLYYPIAPYIIKQYPQLKDEEWL